jgi:hypothetical protein
VAPTSRPGRCRRPTSPTTPRHRLGVAGDDDGVDDHVGVDHHLSVDDVHDSAHDHDDRASYDHDHDQLHDDELDHHHELDHHDDGGTERLKPASARTKLERQPG